MSIDCVLGAFHSHDKGVMKMTTKQSLKYQLLAAQCGFGFEILYTIFWGGWHTTCRLPRPV